MSEPSTETVETPAQEPEQQRTDQTTPDQVAEKPPWGEDFDAEKAWKLVQNLRADKEKLSTRAMSDEQQQQLKEYNALVEASKSEAQRKDEAAAAAQRERDDAKAEAARYKIALRHGISEEDFDLLGSGSEEEIEARATKVAAKNEAAKQAELANAVQTPTSPTSRRPTEQLRPGASPSPDPVQDDSYYPSDWLSPSQRSRVEEARTNS